MGERSINPAAIIAGGNTPVSHLRCYCCCRDPPPAAARRGAVDCCCCSCCCYDVGRLAAIQAQAEIQDQGAAPASCDPRGWRWRRRRKLVVAELACRYRQGIQARRVYPLVSGGRTSRILLQQYLWYSRLCAASQVRCLASIQK